MGQVAYRSVVEVLRHGGPRRTAHLPAGEVVAFGVHATTAPSGCVPWPGDDPACGWTRSSADGSLDEPVDDTWLLQEYVEPAAGFITRVEVVGGQFLYALAAETSHGFQLCPADACQVHDAFCPAGEHAARIFSLREAVARYLACLLAERAATNQDQPQTAADGGRPIAHVRP